MPAASLVNFISHLSVWACSCHTLSFVPTKGVVLLPLCLPFLDALTLPPSHFLSVQPGHRRPLQAGDWVWKPNSANKNLQDCVLEPHPFEEEMKKAA